MNGALAAESAPNTDGSRLQSGSFVALRNAISDLRDQVSDGEKSAHSFVNADDGATLNALAKAFNERTAARETAYAQARQAAIGDLLGLSAPPIPQTVSSAQVASMGGLLRDAIMSGGRTGIVHLLRWSSAYLIPPRRRVWIRSSSYQPA
jgi:hypothetical protein